MTACATILLSTPSEEVARAVSSALDAAGDHFALEAVCRDLPELITSLESSPSPAVLLDLDPEPKRVLAALDSIAARYSDTRFVVLSGSLQNELMLEAMQAGARHFLLKDNLDKNLVAVLQRLIGNGAAVTEKPGFVVTVLSLSGGCGATTVSINLANEFQLLTGKPALVVDLDCDYGGAAAHLGLTSDFGLADILDRNGELDPELIRSTAREYSEGLRLLLNPTTVHPAAPPELEYTRLPAAMRVFRQSYAWTVIDAPRVPMDQVPGLIRASDVTLIVLQLTVKDLSMAQAMRAVFLEGGVDTDSLSWVVNRHQKRRMMITLEQAHKTLDGIPVTCLSNDYTSAIKSLNYGQLLADVGARSGLRRELRALAADIQNRFEQDRAVTIGATHDR